MTPLGFGGDYTSFKGSHNNLVDVVLWRKAAHDLVSALASYTGTTTDQEMKKELTSLVVMLCEATSFPPISAAIKAAW